MCLIMNWVLKSIFCPTTYKCNDFTCELSGLQKYFAYMMIFTFQNIWIMQQVLRCSKLIQIKPKISWGPFTCLWNLCGSRRVVLSFGDSRGRKFERGDNIKVVIGSQWIWTILRPWRLSQVGKGDSSTKDFPTMMFKYTSSNNHIDKVV